MDYESVVKEFIRKKQEEMGLDPLATEALEDALTQFASRIQDYPLLNNGPEAKVAGDVWIAVIPVSREEENIAYESPGVRHILPPYIMATLVFDNNPSVLDNLLGEDDVGVIVVSRFGRFAIAAIGVETGYFSCILMSDSLPSTGFRTPPKYMEGEAIIVSAALTATTVAMGCIVAKRHNAADFPMPFTKDFDIRVFDEKGKEI